MSSAIYKKFNPEDISFTQTKVNKSCSISSSNSDGVYSVTFDKNSSNEVSKSYYNTLNTLFYYTHSTAQTHGGYSGSTLYEYGHYDSSAPYEYSPQHRHKFNSNGVVYSISQSIYGDQIKPGTFKLVDNSQTHDVTIKDDSHGNLYTYAASGDGTPTYNDITSGTPSSSISSSENYVGNIFYEHGLAVLTETGSYTGSWDLVSATPETTSPAMTSQDNVPYDFFFKPDGTSYWLCGATNQKAFQYDMSTPWDVSTATYANVESPTLDSFLRSIHFKDDGSKMFTLSRNTDLIKTYNLSTAWDVSTATDASETFDVWGKDDSTPDGMTFKTDGTKVYIVGNYTNKVFEYNMSTPWDVSTINDTSQSYDISGSIPVEETTFGDIDFKPDGTRMYVPGRDEDNVYEWKLGTAWDVSTATFNVSKSISSEEANITSVRWKPDGSKMYIVGWSNDDITQYDMPSASFYTSSGQSYTIDYSSAVILKTLSFKCHIREDEFNATLNPTVFDGTNHKIKSSALVSPNKNQVRTEKFTYVNFDRNIVNQKFRHEDFRTYFTKIGFYNNAGELLMIASLPRPIQVHNDRPMTVTARIDF